MKVTLEDEALYAQAEKEKSFRRLINHPYLLLRWQTKHPEHIRKISVIASHKLDRHIFCESDEMCEKVEKFIQEQTPGQGTLV
ncbi:MAG: hypothetical protein PHE73_09260 [Sulfurovaceae bacterium]|nr:hypothetical protein [Sulfurovaceae bacterium]